MQFMETICLFGSGAQWKALHFKSSLYLLSVCLYLPPLQDAMRLILLLARKLTVEELPSVTRLMWGNASGGAGGAVRMDLFDFER